MARHAAAGSTTQTALIQCCPALSGRPVPRKDPLDLRRPLPVLQEGDDQEPRRRVRRSVFHGVLARLLIGLLVDDSLYRIVWTHRIYLGHHVTGSTHLDLHCFHPDAWLLMGSLSDLSHICTFGPDTPYAPLVLIPLIHLWSRYHLCTFGPDTHL